MYDSRIASPVIDRVYSIVNDYIDYLDGREEDNHFGKNDAIILYEYRGEYLAIVESLNRILTLDNGRVTLCLLSALVNDSGRYKEPNDDKIYDFVYTFVEPDIPSVVLRMAEKVSDEHSANFKIDFDHKSSGTSYYLCEFFDDDSEYIIGKKGDELFVHEKIEPYAHSYVPDPVFDFLYSGTNEYTYIRYMGMYNGENIFYPCNVDTMLADGYLVPVNELVSYNEFSKKCRYLKGEFANRMYCELSKHV